MSLFEDTCIMLAEQAVEAIDVYGEGMVFVTNSTYSAILDDKVCPLCEELDGMTVEAGAPEFYRWNPPLHGNCRCMWFSEVMDMPWKDSFNRGKVDDPEGWRKPWEDPPADLLKYHQFQDAASLLDIGKEALGLTFATEAWFGEHYPGVTMDQIRAGVDNYYKKSGLELLDFKVDSMMQGISEDEWYRRQWIAGVKRETGGAI